MERPTSQHCFAIAADLERTALALFGLEKMGEVNYPAVFENHDYWLLRDARESLSGVVKTMLDAGNKFKAAGD